MSSLKDLASLIMIPSLVKDGRLDTVKPLGNSIIHPDATGNNDGTDGSTPAEGNFTFSRGTNLSATRVDASQLIEKGRENLLLQSNQFDTTWVNYQSAETGGQPDKDGGSTAWKLTRLVDGANGVLYQTGLSFSLATFSVYAKSAEENWIYIEGVGSTYPAQFFDLQNGVKGTASGAGFVDSNIVSVGDGWHRISITFNISGGNRVSIYQATADNTLSGSIGDGVYIMNAQLESSLVATPYIETGASTAQAGILENTPRLDYSGGASCPSLLLEPSRTNIIPFSEYYNAGSWLKLNSSITDNATTSPEGFVNASLQTENSSAGFHAIYDNITAAFNTPFTFSAFVKPNGRDIVYLRMENASTGGGLAITYFNINTGQILSDSSTSSSIEEFPNGWYRLSITGTTSASTSTLFVMGLASADDTRSYTGNGISGAYFYGASAESGSYPTSYIPTYGVSQTRSRDNANPIDVSSLGVTTGYTLFYELGEFDLTSTTWVIQKNSSGTALYQSYGSTAIISTINGGVYPFGHGVSGTRIKVALAFDGTNINVFTDGVKRGSWVASSDWNTFGDLNLDNNPVRVNWKQLLVFPTALTDSECIALTTI